MNTIERDKQYIAATYARFPIEIVEGKGSLAYDSDGKEYIDMGSGIAVNSFGFSDKLWIAAVEKQLNSFQHTSNLFYSAPDTVLAEKLCTRTGLKKVFFSNSGAEANECAIKAARKYFELNNGGKSGKIITLYKSFHGRTLSTLAATGQDVFHKDFLPLTDGFLYAKANDADEINKLIAENSVAAIMFELCQGEGGVLTLDKQYVKTLSEIAEKNNILLIDDEVQTGNGRSGTLYAYMQYGILPDIVSTAKGLGGGLPLGATLLGEKVKDVFSKGMHGSTFGGNPVCCAGAINVLDRIDDDLLEEVNKKSEFIRSSLKGARGIISVSGIGLMLGIETEKPALEVASECLNNGVMVLTAGKKVRLLPALNISYDLLEKAVAIIKKVCEKE